MLFLTDPKRTPNPIGILQSLPKSANGRLAVIYRHFGAENRVETAQTLAAICKKRRFLLLIGADIGLAAKLGADGVHLPERLARQAKALRQKHPTWLITAAAHSGQAVKAGASAHALLASPVFETDSSGAKGRKRLGAAGLKRLSARSKTPIYALGGVNARTIIQLRALPKVCGIAVSTGLKPEPD